MTRHSRIAWKMGGQGGGGRRPPQARRPRHGALRPFSAPRRHNPQRPPSGASSAAGPPLNDVERRKSAEQAQEPPRYPGHCRYVGSRRIKGAGGTAPTPPSHGHPPMEPLRPHCGKRGHKRCAPIALPGRASQRSRPTPTPTTWPTAPRTRQHQIAVEGQAADNRPHPYARPTWQRRRTRPRAASGAILRVARSPLASAVTRRQRCATRRP
jgi:hypothetical protein